LRKYRYFQGIFYVIVVHGLSVLSVCYGILPTFLCNIAGFLNGFAILFNVITIVMYTFTRFMFVCIWKRMRQMDDNLIVRIATIQAIVLSLLFTAATWLQINLGIVKSIGVQVRFLISSVSLHLLDNKSFNGLKMLINYLSNFASDVYWKLA
jgi:hypothetical protein